MNEREKVLLFSLIAFLVLFYSLFVYVYMSKMTSMNEECESKNGILVKTIEGIKCFDRSMLL